MSHTIPDLDAFTRTVRQGRGNLVPMYRRLLSDQVTPVLAYRRLVAADPRMAPSFLYESVIGGDRVGRYSYLGARPSIEVIARGHDVTKRDDRTGETEQYTSDDPLADMAKLRDGLTLARPPEAVDLPAFTGGWVGYAGYDVVRYLEPEKLTAPPPDDRNLPDMHMGLYRQVVVFDHVRKTLLAITHVVVDEHDSLEAAYEAGQRELDELVSAIERPRPTITEGPQAGFELPVGEVDLASPPPAMGPSNMGEGGYQRAVDKAKQYIAAGDIFQVVPSQRFELHTAADPFDIYRALRVVNPSPYMFYLQFDGGVLVGSSPEILVRVQDGVVTTRPLAGTRRRGATPDEDAALEKELLADPKEIAEHVMLVDLGRNDVGRVARVGTIALPDIMVIERYSHVMHISSTVTGELRDGSTCWDALRHTLPVGTVSGAPKVRAMQIIDELEPTRRGPYAGAVGYADFAGNMDMAIALRTMVVVPGERDGETERRRDDGSWIVYVQAGAGIVADSVPDREHEETVSKAAALAKAVDLAEKAFGR